MYTTVKQGSYPLNGLFLYKISFNIFSRIRCSSREEPKSKGVYGVTAEMDDFLSPKIVSLYRNGAIRQDRKHRCYFLWWDRAKTSNLIKLNLDYNFSSERDSECHFKFNKVAKYLFADSSLDQSEQSLKNKQPIRTVVFSRLDSSGKARQFTHFHF